VTVTAETGAREPELSCLIATTPWSGSQLLCQALRATRLVGDPRDYFNPFEVVTYSVEWRLLRPGHNHLPRYPEQEFARRYLAAVTKAAMGRGGVLSVNLPWSHQRWLARFARAAAPDVPGTPTRSDAAVVEQWFPRTRYLYLTSGEKVRQAGRWYRGQRRGPAAAAGAPHPDFQEIRWIETLISRQEKAWVSYFQVHHIDAYRIEYEDFLTHPEETVGGILSWLGVPGSPARPWRNEARLRRLAVPVDWLPDYVAARDRLSPTIGVYRGQG
jgi:LPS sulfotransferase NodH